MDSPELSVPGVRHRKCITFILTPSERKNVGRCGLKQPILWEITSEEQINSLICSLGLV